MLQAVNKDHELLDNIYLQFMSLSLGNIKLLALQSNIILIEGIQDVDRENPSKRSVGWMHYDNHKIPIYSFTEQLELEQSISIDKTICVVLKDEDTYISLMCLEATSFKHKIVKLTPLPDCMQAAACPIDSLCLYKKADKSDVSFIISAKTIVKYIEEYDI